MDIRFRTITTAGRDFEVWENVDDLSFVKFISNVQFLENGCWKWKGGRLHAKEEYGAYYYRNHSVGAHRFCYMALRGPILHGVHLHHKIEEPTRCIGPACVRPDHLLPVTPQQHFKIHGKKYGVKQRNATCHKGHNNWRLYTDPHGFTMRKCRDCERERGQKALAKHREAHPLTRGVVCKYGHPCTEENGYRTDRQWICRLCRKEAMRQYKERVAAGQVQRSSKTHCINGHEYTDENTTWTPSGERRCKTCANELQQAKRKPRTAKTHCSRGHAWIPENIYEFAKPDGGVYRTCKLCWAARQKQYRVETNRESVIASKRAYYDRNKDELNRKKREARNK